MPSLGLTDAHKAVARLEALGLRPSEIASELGVSKQAVSNAKNSIETHVRVTMDDLPFMIEMGLINRDMLLKMCDPQTVIRAPPRH